MPGSQTGKNEVDLFLIETREPWCNKLKLPRRSGRRRVEAAGTAENRQGRASVTLRGSLFKGFRRSVLLPEVAETREGLVSGLQVVLLLFSSFSGLNTTFKALCEYRQRPGSLVACHDVGESSNHGVLTQTSDKESKGCIRTSAGVQHRSYDRYHDCRLGRATQSRFSPMDQSFQNTLIRVARNRLTLL
ncbi:hypothetical protein HD553DRAFT_325677 [Filobasidium floriforme]|uniref:uncharacterized protein n=1 Tax=Filobasidium floriforme TaxID=5210 RepID=UPI001E8DA0E9|nr:uncharacterized protein HD553DRAFT_325677 [Filobasidium floriforme]KAH8081243.1 hypothetical protein HD553DRAFT_325677 [Filobasidium floriforme]